MTSFNHTVDKRATAALWRESIENHIENPERPLSDMTVEEIISERKSELEKMLHRQKTDLQDTLGHSNFRHLMHLTEMSPQQFNQSRRKHWRPIDYFRFAARMVKFMVASFASRRQYVESVKATDSVLVPDEPKYQRNWEFLAYLSCQPMYRSEEVIDKLYYFLKSYSTLMELFPADVHRELCRVVAYAKYDHGRVISHQDTRPTRFYFVLEGKINRIRRMDLAYNQYVTKSVGWIKKHQHSEPGMVEDQLFNQDQFVSYGLCELLYIDVDDFVILRKVNERIPRFFLKSLPLFKEYPLEKFLDQPGCLECRFFEPGKTVCKNLKSTEFIYICKSGQCAIVRRQQIIDIKKTSSFDKAKTSSSVGAKKPFLHAYETSSTKIIADDRRPPTVKFAASTPDNEKKRRSERKWELSKNFTDNKDPIVMKKTFVKIGLFTKGMVAGLHEQQLTHREGVTNLSLVSEGTEIVTIHKQRFLAMATSHTLAQIQSMFTTYSLESEVQQEMRERQAWPHFKNSFISKYLTDKQRQKALLDPRGNPSLIK